MASLPRDDVQNDPMDMVDAPLDGPSPKKAKTHGRWGTRVRYLTNEAKSTIFYTTMPEKPLEEDPHGRVQRKIALYILDRKTIWLALEDVAWVVRYLYVQNMLKGVPLVQPDSTGPSGVTGYDPSDESAPRGDGGSSYTTD